VVFFGRVMARWVQLDLVEMSLGRRELSLLVISPHVKCCYTRVCTEFVQLIEVFL
jgi:hypothetical protein